MKSNAIIRIITWSLVIVVLLAILTAGLGFRGISLHWRWDDDDVPAETAIPQRVDPTEAHVYMETTFYAAESISIHEKPSEQAEIRGIIEPGDTVHLGKDQLINGQHWGYVTDPGAGWILLDDYTEETVPAEPEATAPTNAEPSSAEPPASPSTNGADARSYSCNASDVSEISIEWAAGNIHIIPVDGNQIRVTETGDFEKHPMTIKTKNGKLSIDYCEEKAALAIGLNYKFSKDLTIEVPKDFLLQELDIDAASAAVLIQDLTIREVEFDGASGICEFTNCSVDQLDIDTASGDIRFSGSLNELDCDAASASFIGVLNNVPSRLEMDSMSGNLDVTLPSNAGFTATVEGLSSDFSSDFETTSRNSSFIYGDGRCRIKMDAMSGDVIIRKSQ